MAPAVVFATRKRWRARGAVVLLLLAVVPAGAVPAGAAPARKLTGRLLVATPELRDPRFARTVVYVVQHDRTGALGLIVNRPLADVPLAKVLERFGTEGEGAYGTIRLHYGGPVEGGRGFVLHTADWVGEQTVVVDGKLGMTASPDILRALAAGTGPRRSLLAVGYAGWAPGQLEAELEGGSWVVAAADEGLLFDDDHAGKWQRAREQPLTDL